MDPSPETKASAVRRLLHSIPRTAVQSHALPITAASCASADTGTSKVGRSAGKLGQGRTKVKVVRRCEAAAAKLSPSVDLGVADCG